MFVRVTLKNSLFLNQHNGDDAPQDHEIPFRGSRLVPCGQMDGLSGRQVGRCAHTHTQTDMAKLIVSSCSFAHALTATYIRLIMMTYHALSPDACLSVLVL